MAKPDSAADHPPAYEFFGEHEGHSIHNALQPEAGLHDTPHSFSAYPYSTIDYQPVVTPTPNLPPKIDALSLAVPKIQPMKFKCVRSCKMLAAKDLRTSAPLKQHIALRRNPLPGERLWLITLQISDIGIMKLDAHASPIFHNFWPCPGSVRGHFEQL